MGGRETGEAVSMARQRPSEPIESHEIEIRVRYAECDPMGLAHHSAYPVWMEMGRPELLRATRALDYRELEDRGYLLAVVDLAIRYRRPARYDDLLRLETILVECGPVRIRHDYRLHGGGTPLATASTTLACIDRAGTLQPVPEILLPASGTSENPDSGARSDR